MVNAKDFISKVEEIAAEEPAYEHGHSGSDGLCDCIGLVIGALKRCGERWSGTHGSNYTARNEMEYLKQVTSSVELTPGELVFKIFSPGNAKYNLPGKYQKGSSMYNGDTQDYYHVGVVVSVYPLRIRHMTSPRPKMDTSIGKWAVRGWLKKVNGGGEEKQMDKAVIYGGNTDKPINMRAAASTAAQIVGEIPQMAEVDVIEGGGYWSQVRHNGKTGYVKSEFVHVSGEEQDGGKVTISRAELEGVYAELGKAYDTLGDLLGKRG